MSGTATELCYLYFPDSLFAICFAHEFLLLVLLLILFMVPLARQKRRAKRLQTFVGKKQATAEVHDYANYCNVSGHGTLKTVENALASKQSVTEHGYTCSDIESVFHRNYGDEQCMSRELEAAMLRNGIAGSLAVIAATCFLTAFYFASWIDGHRMWNSGVMMLMNMLRYVVLYLCMTVTYKDWKVMVFPWMIVCRWQAHEPLADSVSYSIK